MRSWMITAYPADMFSTWSCLRSLQFTRSAAVSAGPAAVRSDFPKSSCVRTCCGWSSTQPRSSKVMRTFCPLPHPTPSPERGCVRRTSRSTAAFSRVVLLAHVLRLVSDTAALRVWREAHWQSCLDLGWVTFEIQKARDRLRPSRAPPWRLRRFLLASEEPNRSQHAQRTYRAAAGH